MPKVYVVTSVHKRYDVRIFYKQCRTLSKAGYEVNLIVQDGEGPEILDGVNIYDIGHPFGNRLYRIILSPLKMYNFLKKSSADIIHLHDPELLPAGFFLKRKNFRVIYDSHEDFPRQILSKHWIYPALRKFVSFLFEKIENRIAKKLDAVIGATPFIAARFKPINQISIDINNYPLLGEFDCVLKNTEESFSRTFCYIGAITRERGISQVVEAVNLLQNVTLVMCGPFESESYSKELQVMPGWRFVDYRGIVDRDEVSQIMASSQAGVVTFLPGPNHNESQPNKMFEYMAAGLPLIASHFPLWKQIVEKNQCGICVNPGSPEEIARAITSLLDDQKLAETMGKAGKNAVTHNLNWENEAVKLVNIYSQIAG
ncbi:glycosyltransferase family 4 protein [Desulfogranum japonicum]|uniref:glycosyltransferase family 4 protein n=1 Tax=Desulfogranum japonicum TaxID=231447 RepID=UPI0004103680|nr:glycosyltransferase family 4 protein [Desulfogranum japonicum]